MGEWLTDNWYLVALLVIYALERSPEVLKAILSYSTKTSRRSTDPIPEVDAEGVPVTEDDKKRRSLGSKLLSGALQLLPVVSRIRGRK